jgi:hypothetical protein
VGSVAVRAAAAAVALAAVALSACTSSPPSTDTTNTVIVTHSPTTTPPVFKPPAAGYAGALGPGDAVPKGEAERFCPYIKSTHIEDPVNSVAVIEGDRVGRTTVLTTTKPVGCRFYFAYGPYGAIADIVPRTFATPLAAHNAMVLTAKAGRRAQGVPKLIPGVEAVLYQTKFYQPDGSTDWACVFTKGTVMVIVHTRQNDLSFNAKALATAIAPKF